MILLTLPTHFKYIRTGSYKKICIYHISHRIRAVVGMQKNNEQKYVMIMMIKRLPRVDNNNALI